MSGSGSSDSSAGALPELDPVQARIVGALIEKQATTPEAYPLTANAVVLACNQKNNREPVLELEAGEIGHALRELENRGLVKSVHGARAQRYEHRFTTTYSVTVRQQAILCVMLLRGPQTVSELLTRCERLAAFDDLDQVRLTLERLSERSPPLVARLGRAAGQREDRYMHLLCGPIDEASFAPVQAASASAPRVSRESQESRIDALELQVQSLREELDQLRQQLQA